MKTFRRSERQVKVRAKSMQTLEMDKGSQVQILSARPMNRL
ncbi:hypothetical protein EDD33_2726 [Nocardioides aurantiacus]|uniref:Uncharacterized protein n=1 Tax=Nocardioides aurantiacus TaxID=86796 RepID=A0A3N2CWI6_9ACTN|nr:hypothetical protein EDD33_2726 [Nocardioides aurantiacus]